jgi:hypothetical protein
MFLLFMFHFSCSRATADASLGPLQGIQNAPLAALRAKIRIQKQITTIKIGELHRIASAVIV